MLKKNDMEKGIILALSIAMIIAFSTLYIILHIEKKPIHIGYFIAGLIFTIIGLSCLALLISTSYK